MVIPGIITIILFGYLFINFLYPKFVALEKIALGYLLGIGFFTLFLFIANTLGIKYDLINFSIIISFLITLGLLLNLRFKTASFLIQAISLQKIRNTFISLTEPDKYILVVITFLILSSFVINIYWPVSDWDSLALYDFRAKLFYISGYMDEAIKLGYFFGYPLLTSLSHMLVYLLGGENPMFLYSLYYASLLICFYYALKRAEIKRNIALIFTLLLASSGLIFEHSTWAYSNLPYSSYLFLGIVYAYLWQKKLENGLFIISAMLIGLSVWTRASEPFWLAIAFLVIIFSVIRRRFSIAFIYAAIIEIIRYPWFSFFSDKNGNSLSVEKNLSETIVSISIKLNTINILKVFDYLWKSVFSRYLLLVLIFIFSVYYLPRYLKNKNYSVIFLFSSIFILIASIFIGTYTLIYSFETWDKIGDSAYRMSMFLIPSI